jgi:hypothetical protein
VNTGSGTSALAGIVISVDYAGDSFTSLFAADQKIKLKGVSLSSLHATLGSALDGGYLRAKRIANGSLQTNA